MVEVHISNHSRKAARELDDTGERWQIRNEPEGEQSMIALEEPKDYSHPSSHLQALEWRHKLAESLRRVDLGLSGFINPGERRPSARQRENPRRKELISEKNRLLECSGRLKVYFGRFGSLNRRRVSESKIVQEDEEVRKLADATFKLEDELRERGIKDRAAWQTHDEMKDELFYRVAVSSEYAADE